MCNIYQPRVRRIPNTCATYTNRMWSACKTYTWIICPNKCISTLSYVSCLRGLCATYARSLCKPTRKVLFCKNRALFWAWHKQCRKHRANKTFKNHKLNTNAAQNKHMCCFCLAYARSLRIVCVSFAHRLRCVCVSVYVSHGIRPYFVEKCKNKALFFRRHKKNK